MGTIKEVGKGNKVFEICPICGHDNWCATSVTDDAKAMFIICKRDTQKKDMPGFKYIKDTRKEHCSMYQITNSNGTSNNYQQYVSIKSAAEVKRKSDKELDYLNKKLISMLNLEDVHRLKLNNEGYNDEFIKKLNIKSFPVTDYERKTMKISSKNQYRWELARELLKYCNGDLTGFPGAYIVERDDSKYWTLAGYGGTVFSIQNVYQETVMLQVKLDNPDPKFGKYRVLSSESERFKNGCGPTARIGFVVPEVMGDTYVCYITEGYKKAVKGAKSLGSLFLTVQGVNSWSELLTVNERGERPVDVLRNKYGVKLFIIAYDNDKHRNKYVMQAQQVVVNELKKEGFYTAVAEWDSYAGKGLDDILDNGYKPMYHLV